MFGLCSVELPAPSHFRTTHLPVAVGCTGSFARAEREYSTGIIEVKESGSYLTLSVIPFKSPPDPSHGALEGEFCVSVGHAVAPDVCDLQVVLNKSVGCN